MLMSSWVGGSTLGLVIYGVPSLKDEAPKDGFWVDPVLGPFCQGNYKFVKKNETFDLGRRHVAQFMFVLPVFNEGLWSQPFFAPDLIEKSPSSLAEDAALNVPVGGSKVSIKNKKRILIRQLQVG